MQQNETTLNNYRELNDVLSGYPVYHENYGDALLNTKQFDKALLQYKSALTNSSSPNVFSKVGFCYQYLNQYDSSEYYYTLVQNMQPYKFYPKLTLLKLYLLKQDTAMIKSKATEIKEMPIKVRSPKVQYIKRYADSILTTLKKT